MQAFSFIIHPPALKRPFSTNEDTAWPPQCHNFDSTAGAGGFTAGAAAPAVNTLEEALPSEVFYMEDTNQSAHVDLNYCLTDDSGKSGLEPDLEKGFITRVVDSSYELVSSFCA